MEASGKTWSRVNGADDIGGAADRSSRLSISRLGVISPVTSIHKAGCTRARFIRSDGVESPSGRIEARHAATSSSAISRDRAATSSSPGRVAASCNAVVPPCAPAHPARYAYQRSDDLDRTGCTIRLAPNNPNCADRARVSEAEMAKAARSGAPRGVVQIAALDQMADESRSRRVAPTAQPPLSPRRPGRRHSHRDRREIAAVHDRSGGIDSSAQA